MSMLPFYLTFACISVLSLFDFAAGLRAYKIFCFWFMVLFLVLLASFRSVGVGSDDQAYMAIFSSVPSLLECEGVFCGYKYSEYNVEFGFFWLLSLLSVFGTAQYWLFAPIAFLSVYLNLKSIRSFSPYVGASSLIYFSHFFLAKEMNAIRVGLASAILFYAAFLLTRRRYFFAFLLFLMAGSIHISSIFFLIPVAVYLIAPGRLVLVSSAFFLLLFSWFFDLKVFFNHFSDLGFVGDKIQLYLSAEAYSYALPVFDIVNSRNLLIVFTGLLYWDRLSSRYEWFNVSFYFFYSATFFRIVCGDFAILAGRGYSTISMFEYVLIPFLVFGLLGCRVAYLIVCLYALLTLWLNLTINSGWSGGVEFFYDLV
ncbi:EpsG family protein [Metapseudomonas resinovorans]|uniref:EpsG family protein n=1 Tax=Metapseudomonas resinovorans TaxID=53412 RepID=UPI000987D13E|nr:EpsG family protein [Pseudomonas resinovorans]